MKLVDLQFKDNSFIVTLPSSKVIELNVLTWTMIYDLNDYDSHEKKLIHDILQRITNMCSLCEHFIQACKKHGLRDLHEFPSIYSTCNGLICDLDVYYFDDVDKTKALHNYLTMLVNKKWRVKK